MFKKQRRPTPSKYTALIHKELLAFLGGKVYKQFIHEAGKCRELMYQYMGKDTTTAWNIINGSLIWDHTAQGWGYWNDINMRWRDHIERDPVKAELIVSLRRPDTFDRDKIE